MNYGSLRRYLNLRYMKAPDEGGAGGGGVMPSGSDSGGAPPAGGDGGGSSVSPPSDGGGASTSSPPSSDSSDPWAGLGGGDDGDVIEIPPAALPSSPATPTPTPPAQPAVAPTPAQTATPPSQPQPTQPQPAQGTPQPPTQQTPEPGAPQVQLSPSDPAGMAAAMEANAPALIEHLAQTRFALSPEEVQAIETDAVGAIPKLLARVHLDSHIAMQKFLAQAVPGMIQQFTQRSQANSAAEDKFFSAHKETLGLDKNNQQHREAAVRVARMYRQMYPNATLDQLISDIGPMVAKAVGVGAPPSQAVAPGTVIRGGVPFRPAVNGGGTPVNPNPPAGDGNDWSALGRDFD